jgi:hypothetical protein
MGSSPIGIGSQDNLNFHYNICPGKYLGKPSRVREAGEEDPLEFSGKPESPLVLEFLLLSCPGMVFFLICLIILVKMKYSDLSPASRESGGEPGNSLSKCLAFKLAGHSG